MRRLVLVLLFLTTPALARPTVEGLLEQADAAIARKDYARAVALYQDARRIVADAPDVSSAARIQHGLAVADLGLLRGAVETTTRIAGDDLAALEELHRLHLRLRTIGGDPVLEQEIARAMDIRASLLIDPHEQNEAMTNVAPVLEIARFPQLSDSARSRLARLAAKPWRILSARAQSADPLVAATFAGLAARISGTPVADRANVRDAALFEFRRGGTVTVTAAPGCEQIAPSVASLTQQGAVEVGAEVTVDGCRVVATRTEVRDEQEAYIEHVPYEAEEAYTEQVCYEVQVPVQVCTAIYSITCAASGQSVSRYECSTATRTRRVTRYRPEPRSRPVKRTYGHVTYGANLAWTRTHGATRSDSTQAISTTLVNGEGTPLAEVARQVIARSLDEPVATFVTERVATLRTQADAARAAGDLDRAEAALLRLVLLGRPDDEYFRRTYFVDGETVRAALSARAATSPAFEAIEVVPLPAITDERADVVAVIRDRLAAQFPPALARVQGAWFHADFGAISVPVVEVAGQRVGGGTAAAYGMYLGSPVLSRLHGRTEGLGFWDDVRAGFDLGYTATKPRSGDRGYTLHGAVTYTGAIGFRLPWLQVLAGARASAGALRLGASHGVTASTAYYGNLGLSLGGPSLTLEAFHHTPVGYPVRGATVWFTRRKAQADREAEMKRRGDSSALNNNYLGARLEETTYRACAAAPTECVSTSDLRAWTAMFVIGFGVGR